MEYVKKEFKAGDILSALDLNNIGDGIEEAINLAQEGAAGAANMEKGTGASATQQLPDGVADGFDFTGKNSNATAIDETLTGIIPYGATGEFASAFGGKCAAMGKRSHAEGTTTIAKGKYSHAEGDNCVALGDDSHAEGYKTVAFGQASHAEGYGTKATSLYAHSEGQDTEASGNYSHAAGYKTVALGAGSYAGGRSTIAGYVYQTVTGHFNDNKAYTLFEVGNGSSDNERSNAFEVHRDGDIGIYKDGKIYSLHKMLAAYFTDANLK